MTTREFCKLEYEKAARDTIEHSTLVLTPSGAAGWLLASSGGDTKRAIALAPPGKFWAEKVCKVLKTINQEETK